MNDIEATNKIEDKGQMQQIAQIEQIWTSKQNRTNRTSWTKEKYNKKEQTSYI